MSIVIPVALQKQDEKNAQTTKLSSKKLFENNNELIIEHQNEIYYLRLTKQNKLVLTK